MPDTTTETLVDERTSDELDKLADNETPRNAERPMKEEPTPEATAKTKEEELYEFDHGGKKVKGTREQLIKWAQMGYDRPQAMQKFNKERSEWEKAKQDYEKNYGIYKQVDEYAKNNKQWWDHVLQSWQTKSVPTQAVSGQAVPIQGQMAPAALPPEVNEQLKQMNEFIKQQQQEKVLQKQKEEDQKLTSDVQAIREQHKELDWVSLDENGKSLELRVLEHAQSNGIPTFRAAFRDLLQEDLLSRAQAKARIDVAKGIQNKTKLGVLGESPTSKQWTPKSSTKNIRQTSYEELENEIREELRSSRRA